MDSFLIIKNFFDRMYSYERKTFKRFLLLNGSIEDNSRSIQLFQLFEKYIGNEANQNLFIEKIYKKSDKNNSDSFRKLIERFRDKMYESHFLDINIYKEDFSSPFFMAIMEVKKLVGLSYSIMSKGVPKSEAIRILNRGILLSKKFEFFDELLIFLKLKLDFQGFYLGYAKQKLLFDEIVFAEKCKNDLFDSKKLFYFFINDLQFKSTDELKIREDIRNACDRAKDIYIQNNLVNIFYDWHTLEIQYYHYCTDYVKAEILLLKLLDFLKLNSELFQFRKIADAFNNLSYTQAFLFKFNDALDSISKASEYSTSNINIKNFYKEHKAIINIYIQEYNIAINLIEEILNTGASGNYPIQLSIRIYLLATVKFLAGDYKKSFKLLQETREIENDKEGWNIGIRMLQIFLTLETEKVDLADQRIESLRKHIERTSKMKSVRKRDVVIFRLLNHLSRSGFDFQEVWEDRQKDFKLLQSDEPDYRWIPRSHELILFEQWFEAKVNGVPYHPKFPQPIADEKVD